MKIRSNMKRIISALLVLVLVFSAFPMHVFGATSSNAPIDAAIIFTDLHTNKSDYKQSTVTGIFGAIRNAGLPVSTVTSGGDAFSVNNDSDWSNGKYTGYTATINGYIRNALGNANIPINYVWSDHDRYAVLEDGKTLLDKSSRLVYGAGNDGVYGTSDDGNYYIYLLSMGDLSTNDRYSAGFSSNRAANGFTATVDQAIANFQADAAKLKKDRPLLIVSHQPLLDNRNDNGHAYKWCTAINAVAENMDVAFFFGHNHKYDTASDYYYAKGSTMSVCSDSSGNAKSVKLNFAHICGGYMEPTSTGSYSSSGTRRNVIMAVLIYEDSLQYTTYTSSGVYTGNYALNVTVPRDHAIVAEPEVPAPTEPEVTEPAPTEPEATEPAPTEPVPTEPEATEPAPTEPEATEPTVPEEPEVSGTIWRKASSIEAGKRYILVNYGYNDSNVDTYAVNSTAGATAVTVKTDANGAYIVSDDQTLVWTATAKSSQFTLKSADNNKYLRSASYTSGTRGVDISANSTAGTYSNWSLETKNGSQVLAVRRSGSSNYYPARYTGTKFQAFASSQVALQKNWLVVFVETEENAHQHKFETVTVAATCTTDGSVTSTCACGEQTIEVLKALGHNYSCTETAPTCTAEGSKVYTCATCGDTYAEAIPATGHSYTAETTQATCTQDGVITYTCVCGDTYAEVIPATGHSYTAETTQATCTQDGVITYTCACGDTYAEAIPATGHHYEAIVTAPTCEEMGFTVHTCICGDSYVTDEVAALGHDYEATVTAPTCEEKGYTTFTCVCGDSYVTDEVAALGHDYEAVVTAPTCEEKGYTTFTCACGHSYVAEEVAALGHDYEAVVTAPTCKEKGYTTFTCACGHSYVAEEVAALGHSYTSAEVDGYMVYTCACGHSYSEKLASELSYEKVSSLANDNRYVITLTSGGKYYALSHKNNTISAVQVTVSNGVITSEITEDMVWTCSDKKLSYEDGDTTYYLYAKSSGWWGTPTLALSTSNSTSVTFNNSKIKVGTYYLRYSAGKISLNRAATTANLFQETVK